jgi:hypothetical protein
MPRSALGYMRQLIEYAKGRAVVASLGGRYFGMDRDKRWDRTEKWYRVAVEGKGPEGTDPLDVIGAAYERNETDEFITPTVVVQDGQPVAPMRDGDSLICFNYRADRMRQMVRALTQPDFDEFANAVLAACKDLTMQMARDAEGMTRIAHLTVTGAHTNEEAKVAAKAIVENNLVKCSWYGGDPYWGRLLAAAGSTGVELNVAKSRVSYGGTVVAKGGVGVDHDGQALAEHMMGDEVDIEVHLGAGHASARMIGIDLGPGYIKENSKTS